MSFIQIVSIIFTLLFLGIVFRLVMKRKLREEFSIIWIFCALFLNLFAFWRDGIEVLADFFGIFYPPAIIFMVLFIAIIIYCLHLSILISRHREEIKNVTQELAILKQDLEQIKLNTTTKKETI
ncbi:MAG: DUF2304 domain-containing protein [Fluviicola sp.]|nr:DUF2304 domain-containing protein [Fluviicola sp.]